MLTIPSTRGFLEVRLDPARLAIAADWNPTSSGKAIKLS